MKRYYYAGGTRVAMRTGGSLLNYLLGDHLGSTAITTSSSGSKTAEIRYMPWGGTRYTSGTTPTTFRFTGQREAEAGLYFYNARWYDSALGRFVQGDTLIPNPGDPASYDRYSYVKNNPVKYTDPSGHRKCTADEAATGDETCEQNYDPVEWIQLLKYLYGWDIYGGEWTIEELTILYDTAKDIIEYVDNLTGGHGGTWFQENMGNITIIHGGLPGPNNYVSGNIINLLSGGGWNKVTFAHELAHIWDNRTGSRNCEATWCGGGAADAMVLAMNGNPNGCVLRWECVGVNRSEYRLYIAGDSPWPAGSYANNSVADDFADTFAYAIYTPGRVPMARRVWMEAFVSLTATNTP